MASFNVKLGGMAFGSETFNYHLDAAFFNEIGQSEVRGGAVEATVTVDRKREDYFDFTIECSGTLVIACDRCLDDMEHEVDTTYEVSVKLQGDDYDDSRDELILVPESWRELDVAPLVRDTVLLTIPMTHVHEPGECNREMESLLSDHAAEGLSDDASGDNTQQGDAAQEEQNGLVDPRWAALLKLKENN